MAWDDLRLREASRIAGIIKKREKSLGSLFLLFSFITQHQQPRTPITITSNLPQPHTLLHLSVPHTLPSLSFSLLYSLHLSIHTSRKKKKQKETLDPWSCPISSGVFWDLLLFLFSSISLCCSIRLPPYTPTWLDFPSLSVLDRWAHPFHPSNSNALSTDVFEDMRIPVTIITSNSGPSLDLSIDSN